MKVNYIIGNTPTRMHGLLRTQDYIMKYLIDKGIDLKTISFKKPRKGLGWLNDYITYPTRIKSLSENCINHINRPDLALLLNYYQIPNSIVTCQDIQQLALPNYIWNHSRLKFLLGFKGMRKADKIITSSNFSKNEINRFLKIPKQKVIVAYNGVNRELFKKSQKQNVKYRGKILKNFILSVSSEQPRKNTKTLLRIIAKLKDEISDILLIKIGMPDYPNARKKTLNLIKKLKLQKNVILIDYVHASKLPKFYNAASLFITTTYYEGFGLPPLEAMACECPVVSSNAASLPEVLGLDYPMCNPFDIDCYINQIKKIIENSDYHRRLIQLGSKRVGQFKWEITARKTLQAYEVIWANM